MYITEGQYPEDVTANEKRVIHRKAAARVSLREGELLYKNTVQEDCTGRRWQESEIS